MTTTIEETFQDRMSREIKHLREKECDKQRLRAARLRGLELVEAYAATLNEEDRLALATVIQ